MFKMTRIRISYVTHISGLTVFSVGHRYPKSRYNDVARDRRDPQQHDSLSNDGCDITGIIPWLTVIDLFVSIHLIIMSNTVNLKLFTWNATGVTTGDCC